MMSTDPFGGARGKANEALGNAIVEALRKRGYEAVYAPTKEEALAEVLKRIPKGASVGVPGSVTIREIGAMEELAGRGCTVFQHWGPMTPEEARQARTDEGNADWFLTSANAISWDGDIVSIDGAGNRVGAMAWGRGALMFVIGLNKAAPTLEAAIRRARSASIPNAIRLDWKTACASAGRCVDCSGPSRMCRALLILEAPTMGRETCVILVGEALGY